MKLNFFRICRGFIEGIGLAVFFKLFSRLEDGVYFWERVMYFGGIIFFGFSRWKKFFKGRCSFGILG